MWGAEGWEGSVAGVQSMGFFVALLLCGDPDPSGSGVLSQERNEGPLSWWLSAQVLPGTGKGLWITVNPFHCFSTG